MTPYYDDGTCVIYHGDAREILAAPYVYQVFPAGKADLVLTDPPYGINSVDGNGTMAGAGVVPRREYLPVHGDDQPMEVLWLEALAPRVIAWGADHAADLPRRGRFLVWDKRVGMASNDRADCEIAWDSKGGPARVIQHRQVGMLHDGYGDVDRCHPNQKPLRVMRWCLGFADDAETVLDPFMGSGTTLRAAKDLGRKAIGIEIEERYCEIAAKRLAQEVLDFGGAA